MIPNHDRFITAIHEKKQIGVRFYSKADDGVLDRICAPLDYGPGGEVQDGLNRYWLWDYGNTPGAQMVGLLPAQIVGLRVLGEAFNPAHFGVKPWAWSTLRDWGSVS